MKSSKIILLVFFSCFQFVFSQNNSTLLKELKELISSHSNFTMQDYGGDYNTHYSTSIGFITDYLVKVTVQQTSSPNAIRTYNTYLDVYGTNTKVKQCYEIEEYIFNLKDLKTYNGFYANGISFNFGNYPTNSLYLSLQNNAKYKHYYYVKSHHKNDYNKTYDFYYDVYNQKYFVNNSNAVKSISTNTKDYLVIPLKKITSNNNSFIVKLDHLLIQYNFPGYSTAFEYYPNTYLVKYQSIYKGNKVDGYSRDFYDDGTINVIKFYKNGKEQAKIEQRLKNNKLVLNNGNGTFYTFYPNGSTKTESEHRLGKRDGKTSWYYENGQLDQTIIYKYDENLTEGLRWEVLSSFDENGKPREKGTLKNGNGTIILYDNNGKKSGVMNIQNGILISTTKI